MNEDSDKSKHYLAHNVKRSAKLRLLSNEKNKFELKKLKLINLSLYPPPNWSIKDVGNWLIKIEFSQYINIFKNNLIDGTILFDMEYEDIKNIINCHEDSLIILDYIHREKALQLYYINNTLIQIINTDRIEYNANAKLKSNRKEIFDTKKEIQNIEQQLKNAKYQLENANEKLKVKEKEEKKANINLKKVSEECTNYKMKLHSRQARSIVPPHGGFMELMEKQFKDTMIAAQLSTQDATESQRILKDNLYLMDDGERDTLEKAINIFPYNAVKKWTELFSLNESDEKKMHINKFSSQKSAALDKLILYTEKIITHSKILSYSEKSQIAQKICIIKNPEMVQPDILNVIFTEILKVIYNLVSKEKDILTPLEIEDLQNNINVFKD